MRIEPPGAGSPSADFEVPLEMLGACHGRVQQQCELLERLLEHLPRHGVDAQARDAAARVMRYFDTAARDHHADEEVDLFPALLEAMAGSDAVCLRGMMQRVSDEHRALEQRWSALRQALQALHDGAARTLDETLAHDFIDAYARHIAYEEAEVLPMAARLLDDEQLARIGRAMRERRGVGAV